MPRGSGVWGFPWERTGLMVVSRGSGIGAREGWGWVAVNPLGHPRAACGGGAVGQRPALTTVFPQPALHPPVKWDPCVLPCMELVG